MKVLSLSTTDLGDRDEYILKPGLHTFPFSFVLPLEIPSSFEGEHGHVRYIAKGTIDRSWSFNDHTKRAFTVIGLLDLNKLPLADVSSCKSLLRRYCSDLLEIQFLNSAILYHILARSREFSRNERVLSVL